MSQLIFSFFFPQAHSCLRLHKAFPKGSPKGYYFSSLQSLSVIISKISSYPKITAYRTQIFICKLQMEIQWEKKSDLFCSWICCGAKWNVSLCKNEVCVSAFSVNFTVLYFMRFVLNFTLTTLKPKARDLNSTAISKRWGSKAERVWEMSCAWLAEWHNYAEFNLWKMAQRKKHSTGKHARVSAARFLRQFERAIDFPVHLLLLLKQG